MLPFENLHLFLASFCFRWTLGRSMCITLNLPTMSHPGFLPGCIALEVHRDAAALEVHRDAASTGLWQGVVMHLCSIYWSCHIQTIYRCFAGFYERSCGCGCYQDSFSQRQGIDIQLLFHGLQFWLFFFYFYLMEGWLHLQSPRRSLPCGRQGHFTLAE